MDAKLRKIKWNSAYYALDKREKDYKRNEPVFSKPGEAEFGRLRKYLSTNFLGVDEAISKEEWELLRFIFVDFWYKSRLYRSMKIYFCPPYSPEPEFVIDEKRREAGRRTDMDTISKNIHQLLFDLEDVDALVEVKSIVFSHLVNLYVSDILDVNNELKEFLIYNGCKINKRSTRFRNSILLKIGDGLKPEEIVSLVIDTMSKFYEEKQRN